MVYCVRRQCPIATELSVYVMTRSSRTKWRARCRRNYCLCFDTSVAFVRIVYVLYTYCIRIVYVLYTYCIRIVYVLYTYCIRIVYVLYTYCIRIVYVLYTDTSFLTTLLIYCSCQCGNIRCANIYIYIYIYILHQPSHIINISLV